MATSEEIENVIQTTDMVDLVSPFVKLVKSGKNYKGLCPFHDEKTPSFTVSQEKHLAHCFSCGKGGNPIQFLMDIKQISFVEALHELAEKNGVAISGAYKKSGPDYSKYYEMMDVASKFFQQNLNMTKSGKEAKAYLAQRGISEEMIHTFEIGLAPAGYDLLYKVLKESNYLELDMLDLGLISKNDKGYYDLFTRRITFPIKDEQGHTIGFSARIFDNKDPNQPKYVNTKDTFLYHKGNVLYHLDLAKSEILKKKRVILHEGQMDVIAATQAGFKETICTMGTALTLDQAYILKKYTNHAIICYDGDKAGIKASKKAIQIFKQAGMQVHLVLLPNGMDPDEFVLKNGKEAYLTFFDHHILDEVEYLFETSFLNQNLEDYVTVETIKKDIFQLLIKLPSQTIKNRYLEKLANKLNTKLSLLEMDYNSYCTTIPKTKPVEESFEDDFYNFPSLNETTKIKKEKKNYELRLFLYARNSRQRALDIDKKICECMDVFEPIHQDIWSALVDIYYNKYETFDDSLFCSILTEQQKEVYLENLERLRGAIEVYNDEDLALIIEKMRAEHMKLVNKGIDDVILKTDDYQLKLKKIEEKFENKKKYMPNRRKQ
ncbi:MAG: DNA primase [Anaeroplasmataceae bacterium]|nr:DNA primase [Anaeroplasmataceae bacterium]